MSSDLRKPKPMREIFKFEPITICFGKATSISWAYNSFASHTSFNWCYYLNKIITETNTLFFCARCLWKWGTFRKAIVCLSIWMKPQLKPFDLAYWEHYVQSSYQMQIIKLNLFLTSHYSIDFLHFPRNEIIIDQLIGNKQQQQKRTWRTIPEQNSIHPQSCTGCCAAQIGCFIYSFARLFFGVKRERLNKKERETLNN